MSYWAIFVAGTSLVPSVVVQSFGGATALAVIIVSIHRGEMRYLLPVAILFIPLSALSGSTFDGTNRIYSSVVLLGFPAVGFVVALSRLGRISSPALRRLSHRVAFLQGWVVLFATLAAARGISAGNDRWTRSLHIALPLAGFLIGVVTTTREASRRRTRRSVLALAAIGGVLVAVPALGGHVIFLIAGVFGAWAGYVLAQARRWSLVIVVLPPLAIIFFGTFTMTLIAVVGAIVSFLVHRRAGSARALARVALVAVPLTAVLTALLSVGTSSIPGSYAEVSTGNALIGRAQLKLWDDRWPMWSQSGAQMAEELPVVAASGRSIKLVDYPLRGVGVQEWIGGLHNLYLEALFQLGSLGGLGLIGLVLYLAVSGMEVLRREARRTGGLTDSVTLAASGWLGILLVGSVTGQFLVETRVGTWFWLALGLLLAASSAGVPSQQGTERSNFLHQPALRVQPTELCTRRIGRW